MKLKTISTLCFAASTMLLASSAMAWESEDGQHSTSASVALSSDYVWRGYSQTDEEAAISGSFDYAHSSGFYAGTWASNIDFDTTVNGDVDAGAEVDIYAGFGGAFGESGIAYDLGVLRYIYPGDAGLDWNEVYGSLSYSFFSIGVAHSGNVYNSGEKGTYYSAGFDYDLPYDISLSAGVGLYDYDDAVSTENHTDYRIGLSKAAAGFDFNATYYVMDSDGKDAYSTDNGWNNDLGDGRLVFTISKSM